MTTEFTLSILEHARYIVDCGWTQNAHVRDVAGFSGIPLLHPNAARYCAVGAVLRAAQAIPGVRRFAIESEAAFRCIRQEARGGVAIWNDAPGRNKDEVLAEFDRAIEKLRPAREHWTVLSKQGPSRRRKLAT